MLFTEPIWLSILIPIAFALILLIASLVVRHVGGVRINVAAWLSIAGFALAFVTDGILIAAVLVGFVLFTHWIAATIERVGDRRNREASPGWSPARAWLAFAVALDIVMVVAISRAGIFPGIFPGAPDGIGKTIVPFGVSYFAFHGISYLVDVYRGRVPAERSRWRIAVYLLLLPQIVGGPLAARDVALQLARLPTVSDYSYGARRLFLGAWKVFVIADIAGTQVDAAFARRPGGLSAFPAWLGLVSLTVQMYYGFSGYSDMGIGLGRMLGIRLPENFRWPYIGESVRDFWSRWHIGLCAWFRDYTDVSADGDRVLPPSVGREALVVLLCGLWYGVSWTSSLIRGPLPPGFAVSVPLLPGFAVWGLYHAALVALERAGVEAAVRRLPAVLRHVYVLVLVMVGWAVLRSETLGDALLFFKALAGLNSTAVRARPTIGLEVWLVLAAGALGCAPLVKAIQRWTVVIDALIVSLLMMLFAAVLFAWRCGRMVVTPILYWRR